MSFEFGQAHEFSTANISVFARAMRTTGRPVVLVPLGEGLHAGHIALIRAARRLPRAVVIVAWAGTDVPAELAAENVDAVWAYSAEELWPKGLRTVVRPADHRLESVDELARVLTQLVTQLNIVGPSDIVVGEKDYEQIRALQSAVTDLHVPVTVHGVPTVRMPVGIAVSLRNANVDEAAREQALALSAALTAGAHAAEQGADAVLGVARSVLATAGVEPEYLEVRGPDLGEAPDSGDARLLVAATIGGVRLIDNVGLPLGIGFRNLGQEH